MNVNDILPSRCPRCGRELLTRQGKAQALETGRRVRCSCGFSFTMSPIVYILSEKEYKDKSELE